MNKAVQNNKIDFYLFKRQGFTLAEVMLTLVIIGVVAACSLPLVYEKTERKELVHMLGKASSILGNSMYKIAYNTGYSPGDYDYLENEDFIDEFSKVVHVAKSCNTTSECFGNTSEIYVQLDNTPLPEITGKALATSDGMLYSYAGRPANIYGLSEKDKENTIGRIMVDVNGNKKPNKIGLDTYFFYIVKKKGIVPAGAYTNVDCETGQAGFSCASRVLSTNIIDY